MILGKFGPKIWPRKSEVELSWDYLVFKHCHDSSYATIRPPNSQPITQAYWTAFSSVLCLIRRTAARKWKAFGRYVSSVTIIDTWWEYILILQYPRKLLVNVDHCNMCQAGAPKKVMKEMERIRPRFVVLLSRCCWSLFTKFLHTPTTLQFVLGSPIYEDSRDLRTLIQ